MVRTNNYKIYCGFMKLPEMHAILLLCLSEMHISRPFTEKSKLSSNNCLNVHNYNFDNRKETFVTSFVNWQKFSHIILINHHAELF
jgi:hypothetical protein